MSFLLPASSLAYLRERSALLTPFTSTDSLSIYTLGFVFVTFLPTFSIFPNKISKLFNRKVIYKLSLNENNHKC